MKRSRNFNERGFILATALIAMVVVGAAVVAGYFVANQEYHVGKAVRESMTAFYAAQAGLQREYANWSIRDRWTMDGGQVRNVGPVTLPNGSAYRGTITRIDNTPEADTDTERYYLVNLTGLAQAPLVGQELQNRQAMLLRVRYYDFCCTAAITAKDTVVQAGNSVISGNNFTPLTWAGQCDSASTANVAGAEVECDSCYQKQGAASSIAGSPATEVDTTLISQSLTEWDEVNFEFLASKATKTYAGPYDVATPTDPNPLAVDPMTGLPACDQGRLNNWGAPTDPTHLCFSYFPIIYAAGDLELSGSTNGQGLLVVEGNLHLKGSYEFYGIVLVKGHLVMSGTATGPKLVGSVVVAGQTRPGDPITNSSVSGNANISYSACAVARAKRLAALAKKEVLPLRHWAEALN